MSSLLVPGSATPGAAVAGSTEPGLAVPLGSADYYVTLDTAQTISGDKTFTAEVVIDAGSGPGLLVSRDGTATSPGAMVVHQAEPFGESWFGIYDPTNSLYYGVAQELPGPAGTAMVGGYFHGMGVAGATAGSGLPVFGALNSTQAGLGIGDVAFTVFDDNKIETFNSRLDDGAGNMLLGGGLSTPVTAPTSAYPVTATDSTVLANGASPVTLPDATGITGRVYTIKNIASGSCTVATTSSQSIDGAASYALPAQYKYVTVQSDGSGWFIIAGN